MTVSLTPACARSRDNPKYQPQTHKRNMSWRTRLLRTGGAAALGVGLYAGVQAYRQEEIPVDVRSRKHAAGQNGALGGGRHAQGKASHPPRIQSHTHHPQIVRMELREKPPSRADMWASLRRGTAADPFDVLVVGGGATGAGCAVDAVTR